MSTVQVGFTPATGNSVISGITAGAAAAAGGDDEATANPLGFLGALLDILTQGLQLPDPAKSQAPAAALPPGSAAPTLLFAPEPLAVGAPAATAQAEPGNRDLSEDDQKLLDDLLAALTAMDEASANGQPVDPALEKKLSDTLDELAGMLGITLAAPPAIDPAIRQVAAALGVAAAPELELGQMPPPEPTLPPAVPGQPDAAGSDPLADAFAAAVKGATVPLTPPDETAPEDTRTVRTEAAPAPAPAAGATGDNPDQPTPESRLAALVDKLTAVADKLDGRLPAIADKLQQLASVLGAAGTLDDATLTQLGARLDDADIAALTAPRPEGRAAPPQPFTQPVLPVPTAALETAGAATPPRPAITEPRAGGEPSVEPAEPDAPKDAKVVADAKPVDRPTERPGTEARRADFAQQLSEARGERLADAASQTQPGQAAVAAGRGEAALTPKVVHAAYQAPVQQVNLPQVAFEVVRQFNQGSSRFQIRLDPPELGRIDVRMQIDGDGNLQARMTVERAETLDLMQRDQRQLEKALAQAGLDASKTSLEFSLRQNPQGRDGQPFNQQFNQQQGGNQAPWQDRNAAGDADLPEITTTQYRGLASPSGVNLFV